MRPEEQAAEAKMDPAELYREETFTDRSVGSIRRLTPVRPDGSTDLDRAVLYVGQAQILTPAGALPLSFEIEAQSLEEAVGRFSDAAQEAVERTVEELKELRREAASSIVIPESGQGLGGPGGGKIKFP